MGWKNRVHQGDPIINTCRCTQRLWFAHCRFWWLNVFQKHAVGSKRAICAGKCKCTFVRFSDYKKAFEGQYESQGVCISFCTRTEKSNSQPAKLNSCSLSATPRGRLWGWCHGQSQWALRMAPSASWKIGGWSVGVYWACRNGNRSKRLFPSSF